MKTNHISKLINTMILVAVFSALCFAGAYVAIPFGVSKVHLGNFVCIMAGLLCGGLVGGLSGSIGMGLNDIALHYKQDTFIRTFIVKFLLGFIVGTLFRYLVKKEKKVNLFYIIIGSIFTVLFILFLSLYLIYGPEIAISNEKFMVATVLLVFLGIMSVLFFAFYFISKKLKPILQYVLLASSIACIINIVLEFILKIPLKMLFLDMEFNAAFIYSLTSLPSALFTSIITIIFIILVYYPVYFATRKVNKLNDLYDYIQDNTTINSNEKKTE